MCLSSYTGLWARHLTWNDDILFPKERTVNQYQFQIRKPVFWAWIASADLNCTMHPRLRRPCCLKQIHALFAKLFPRAGYLIPKLSPRGRSRSDHSQAGTSLSLVWVVLVVHRLVRRHVVCSETSGTTTTANAEEATAKSGMIARTRKISNHNIMLESYLRGSCSKLIVELKSPFITHSLNSHFWTHSVGQTKSYHVLFFSWTNPTYVRGSPQISTACFGLFPAFRLPEGTFRKIQQKQPATQPSCKPIGALQKATAPPQSN